MKKGAFAFILHSHLPFVRKAGVWPFGEEWVYEALVDTYIPIIDMLNELKSEHCSSKLTISLTPVLMDQLADKYLLDNFDVYVKDRIGRAEKDIIRFSKNHAFLNTATFYRNFYSDIYDHFNNRYDRDVLGALKKLQDEGRIEVMTSAATHGYLPLLSSDSSIRAQIKVGIDTYRNYMGRQPKGFWLPECAYRPSYEAEQDGKKYVRKAIDEFLKDAGIEFFICDSHAIEGGETFVGKKAYGPYKKPQDVEVDYLKKTDHTTFLPYLLESGCAVFGRNRATGQQVWSGECGYPGDGNYRDFHKKDSDTGFQYWKITSTKTDLGAKEVYVRENVYSRIEENANHFVSLIENMVKDFSSVSNKKGIVAAPYDTELFGHWWFEGTLFLKSVLKKLEQNETVGSTTLTGFLEDNPPQQVIQLPETSWGDGGYHFVWMNAKTEWIWPYIHAAEKKMEEIVSKYPNAKEPLVFCLDQLARELLLLESSDWPFLITTKQAAVYASERFQEHCERFDKIAEAIENNKPENELMDLAKEINQEDDIFEKLDYNIFAKD